MPYAPRATFDNPYGPQITFRTEDVLPPSAYYISPEDSVTVWVLTDLLAQSIYLQLRLLMPTGEIKIIPYLFAPSSTLTWYPAFQVPPWEGYILGALCWSDNAQRGQCYVSMQVMRGSPVNMRQAGVVLLQGYISNLNILSYPTSPLEWTGSGRGALLTIQPPGVTGNVWTAAVPPQTGWRLASLQFQYTSSGAGTARAVGVQLKDSGLNLLGYWFASATQAIGTLGFYCFSPGGPTSALAPVFNIGGPSELYLKPGEILAADVFSLDAADTFSSINLRVEEWMGI